MNVKVEVHSLADFLCEEMEARGWTTATVARRMPGSAARNQMVVDLILVVQKDSLVIGDETFDALSGVFGVSDQLLRNLDAIWRKHPDLRVPFEAPEHIFEPHLYEIKP